MLPPDLDPALPAAEAALDTSEVVRAFVAEWRGTAAPSVTGCATEYLRWWPGAALVATFRLRVADPAVSSCALIRSVVVRPDGVHHASLLEDEGLSGLMDAATPSVVAPWLGDVLGSDIRSCVITPVRYRPRRRCVLRYDVVLAGGPTVLFGKVLPHAEASELASNLTALGPGFTARVAGVAPEWGLVVQADTGGNSLSHIAKSAVSTDDLADVAAAARLLAHLHTLTDPQAPVRTLQGDAADLMEFVAACERFAPEVAGRLRDGAASAAAQPGGGSTAPAHGAFRLDQVHVAASAPLLIDIDSYCFAEPERDLGNLFAYLDWRAIRRPDAREDVRVVRRAFLDSYQQTSWRDVDAARLRVYQAVSLLKIAGRRYPRLKTSEWDRVPQLIDAAFSLLGPIPVAS